MAKDNNQYDARTLVSAALLFIGFALILFFLPNIMLAVGARSHVLAGFVVAGVIVLPFAILWLHARFKRRND